MMKKLILIALIALVGCGQEDLGSSRRGSKSKEPSENKTPAVKPKDEAADMDITCTTKMDAILDNDLTKVTVAQLKFNKQFNTSVVYISQNIRSSEGKLLASRGVKLNVKDQTIDESDYKESCFYNKDLTGIAFVPSVTIVHPFVLRDGAITYFKPGSPYAGSATNFPHYNKVEVSFNPKLKTTITKGVDIETSPYLKNLTLAELINTHFITRENLKIQAFHNATMTKAYVRISFNEVQGDQTVYSFFFMELKAVE